MNAIATLRVPGLHLLVIASTLLLLSPGCESSTRDSACARDAECTEDERCDDSRCVPRVVACSDCAEDEKCLEGTCRKACDSRADCSESEFCNLWKFADGSEQAFCSTIEGRFTGCTNDGECDASAGFHCVEGTCEVACQSHSDCTAVGHCSAKSAGTFCAPGKPATRGQYFTSCPNGAAECDRDAGFSCLGAGAGDLDAYCTTDCTEDRDCPSGFRCGEVRRAPCDAACGVSASPGPNCAPVAEIGEGLRYRCGVLGVIQRVCERRSFCSPCETDEDCLGVPGQICARDSGGARICTVPCDPNSDSCPWGNAAECGLFDPERGIPTCSHRFGACRGTGQGCEPCVADSDCGEGGVCASFNFSGERFCIDLTHACDCGEDADASGTCQGHGCPESPGGLAMTCVARRPGNDPLSERCYGASTTNVLTATQQAGCWPKAR